MSTERPIVSLTPTSYLVLGLLAREGPSTPYELKRHVAATIGHFWAFPHAVLYKEPGRLVELGLATEEREPAGRHRRVFTITEAGREALRAWLGRPAERLPELRDPGLLQLFFADLEPASVGFAIAADQLARHRELLARYEAGQHAESAPMGDSSRSIEHWRGVTLRMGLLHERAAVEFWTGIASHASIADATSQARAEDLGARSAMNEGWQESGY